MGRVEKCPCAQSLLEQRRVGWRWEFSPDLPGWLHSWERRRQYGLQFGCVQSGDARGVTPAVQEARGGTATQGHVRIKAELLGCNI